MKTAIVTGAAGNLGQAVVNKFLEEGYKVIGTVNHDKAGLSDNPDLEIVSINLTDEDKSRQFIESVIKKHASIDVAVLTVGGFAMGKVVETKTSDVVKQYKLNFETAYNVAQPVFTQMMKQGNGRIFLIGSRPGSDARYAKGMVAYGLAKSQLFRLAELMNEEAKGNDVVTTVVAPSTIDTPDNRKSMPQADYRKWVKPEAIADVIALYCDSVTDILRDPVIKVYGDA